MQAPVSGPQTKTSDNKQASSFQALTPSALSVSVVPTGLVPDTTYNPGTEVPGYSHLVPTGLLMAGFKESPFRVSTGLLI